MAYRTETIPIALRLNKLQLDFNVSIDNNIIAIKIFEWY